MIFPHPAGDNRGATRTPARRAWIALAALALALTGCGSKLSDAQLAAANGGLGGTTAGVPASGPAQGPAQGGGGARPGSQTQTTGPGGITGPSSIGGVAAPSAPGAKKSEIRIGSFGTQSGLVGAAIASIPPAIRAWVADVNARGGLNGHPVRLFMEDDGGDSARALTIARTMVEQDHVLCFFGLHAVQSQGAATPYLERNGIPVIGAVQNADADTSPVIFRPGTGSTLGTYRVLIATMVTQFPNVKKAAIINTVEGGATTSKGADLMAQYGPKVGIQIVYRADVSIAQPDYTAQVISARNAGAQGVFLILDWASAIRFIRSANQQGWHVPFAGSSAFHEQGFADQAESDGVASFETVAPFGISPLMNPYINAVKRYSPGGLLGGFGADIWVGGKLFERIASFLGDIPTRKQIFDGLYSLHNDTLGGLVPPITFPRTGSRARVNLCGVAIRVRKGNWTAPLGANVFICGQDDRITLVRV